MQFRYLDEHQDFHSICIGVIVDYGKGYGTFHIQMPFLKDKENIIEDAILLRTYFGKEHGILWEPELHDQVLVYMYGKRVKKAIILGSMPPEDGTLLKQRTNENTDKWIRTKEQIEILFHDEKDKQRFQLLTKKHQFFMDDDKEIIGLGNQQSKQGLQIKQKDGEVHIKAEKKLILECGKSKIAIQEDGTMMFQGDGFMLEARKLHLKGQRDLVLEAQNIRFDAKVKMEGCGKSSVQLSSNGIMEINGNLIKVGS